MNPSIYTIPVTRDIIGLEYLLAIREPHVNVFGFGVGANASSNLVFAFQEKEMSISVDVRKLLGEEEYLKLNIKTVFDFNDEVREKIKSQFILQVLDPFTRAWMQYRLDTIKRNESK